MSKEGRKSGSIPRDTGRAYAKRKGALRAKKTIVILGVAGHQERVRTGRKKSWGATTTWEKDKRSVYFEKGPPARRQRKQKEGPGSKGKKKKKKRH